MKFWRRLAITICSHGNNNNQLWNILQNVNFKISSVNLELSTDLAYLQNLGRVEDRKRFEKIIGSTNIPHEINLVRATRDFAFLRTHLAEVYDFAIVTARQTLLKEVCRCLQLTDAQIVSMAVDEIHDSIEKGQLVLSEEELDLRVDEYAYILEGDFRAVVSGAEIDKYEENEDITTEDESKLPTSVEGMVANPGNVIGPAKILLSPKDNKKVNAGDVIIATMTTPEYISAMEKAAGFVTDEGGITCHAAITSREFGVPCIVGTEFATRIFKDNDILRVDANNGTVQKV